MKKTIFFVIRFRDILILFLLLFCSFFLTLGMQIRTKTIGAFSIPVMNKIIVVDAGHGGADPGAIANGVTEKDLNLKIAQKLCSFIEEGGGIVVLTRNDDVSTTPGKKKIYNKSLDLNERKRMANQSEADIFVSIHMNIGGGRGAQVFYQPKSESGKKLAECIQCSLKILDTKNKHEAKKMDRSIFVLRKVAAPAVVVECGFISNKTESRLLRNDSYQNKIAWHIYLGILKYFSSS